MIAPDGSWFAPFDLFRSEGFPTIRIAAALWGAFSLLGCYLARAPNYPRSILVAAKVSLLLSTLLAISCWFRFFERKYIDYTCIGDFYHYYMGGKYFPELGYTKLYECVALAELEDGVPVSLEAPVRDVRVNKIVTTKELLAEGKCREHFSPERWTSFKRDLGVFRSEAKDLSNWMKLRTDFGYNPTPIWRIAGGLVANAIKISPEMIWIFSQIDLLLLIAIWLIVFWAFGFEAVCAGLIYFTTNIPSDLLVSMGSFVRVFWFCFLLTALCALKRGYPATAGVFFTYSSLLRIFPGFLFFGYLANVIHIWRRDRTFGNRDNKRFVLSCILSAITLILVGWYTSGRPNPYGEFLSNIRKHSDSPSINSIGVKQILSFSFDDTVAKAYSDNPSEGYSTWANRQITNFNERKAIYWGLLLIFGVLFIRSTRRSPLWASMSLAVFWVPFLTNLSGYYYWVLVPLAFLWSVRPWASIGLLFFSWATCIVGLRFHEEDVAYALISVTLIGFAFLSMFEENASNLNEIGAGAAEDAASNANGQRV